MEEGDIGVRELARASGVDPSFISKILSGERNPPSDEEVLRKMAQALKVDPDFLMLTAGRAPEWLSEKLCEGGFLEWLRGQRSGKAASRVASAEPAARRPADRKISEDLPVDLL